MPHQNHVNAPQDLLINFETLVKGRKSPHRSSRLSELYAQGYRRIIVKDLQFDDEFIIKLQKVTGIISGLTMMCFLNRRASYQADSKSAGHFTIPQVINKISGGEVL